MPSRSYADIIAKRPNDAEVLQRLEKLGESRGSDAEYTANRLFDLVQARTMDGLILLLDELVRAGLFVRFFRVESPRGGEIARYQNFLDVPDTVLDVRTGRDIEIEPDLLEVIYHPKP